MSIENRTAITTSSLIFICQSPVLAISLFRMIVMSVTHVSAIGSADPDWLLQLERDERFRGDLDVSSTGKDLRSGAGGCSACGSDCSSLSASGDCAEDGA